MGIRRQQIRILMRRMLVSSLHKEVNFGWAFDTGSHGAFSVSFRAGNSGNSASHKHIA